MTQMETWGSRRDLTAIGRRSLSAPARQSLVDGVLTPDRSFLDYGSGRGGDVVRLKSMGLDAEGWDPQHGDPHPDRPRDVVHLTYVLNVIEGQRERRDVLARAWALTEVCLVVSVRLVWERGQVRGLNVDDGIQTSRGTFQHLFSPRELRELTAEVCARQPVAPSPGTVYLFRRDDQRLEHLARSLELTCPEVSGTDALTQIASFLKNRGRLPEVEELPTPMLQALKHSPLRRLQQAA